MCVSGFLTQPTAVGVCPDPKHFIVNCEKNIVKYVKNGWKCSKNAISI